MSAPYYSDESVTLHHGDCLEVLRSLSKSSVDSVVCDPPYGLSNTDPAHVVEALTRWATGERDYVPTGRGFMGKSWDAFVPPPAVWDECLRVLKPGGHLLAFAGSRTFDLMTLSIRFAGFDIRDSIAWLYGSGFPKSLDVSKAVDKLDAADERRSRALEFTAFIRESGLTASEIDRLTGTNMGGHYITAASQPAVATADLFDLLRPHLPVVPERIEGLVRQRTVESQNYAAREVVGIDRRMNEPSGVVNIGQGERTVIERKITNAHTPAAKQWQGWGTALKPAFEPIVVARKPLAAPGVNVLSHVESSLRDQGVTGEIKWTDAPVSDAARRGQRRSSSATPRPSAGATSASPAAGPVTPNGEQPTASDSGTNTPSGDEPTPNSSAPLDSGPTASCETQSSTPTGESAPAAESPSRPSSPSTTSTAAGPHTASPSTARSMGSSDDSAFLLVTESFAGTATGLTGSRATVRIDKLTDGTFVWPDGLPRTVPGGPITVAANVLAHGTGALNIDATRVAPTGESRPRVDEPSQERRYTNEGGTNFAAKPGVRGGAPEGRWPTNVVMDGDTADALDEQSGTLKSGALKPYTAKAGERVYDHGLDTGDRVKDYTSPADQGGASRFFPTFRYQAKAPTRERIKVDGVAHPTVKPLELMRWLVRLVTPAGGTVLEPFAGSGTTVEAAILESFNCVAIEREADYLPLILARLARNAASILTPDDETAQLDLFGGAA